MRDGKREGKVGARAYIYRGYAPSTDLAHSFPF